jgi:hypothetical protein
MQKDSLKDSPPLTPNPFSGMIRQFAVLWPKHDTRVVLAVAAAGLFAVSAAQAAPTSTLYLTDQTNQTTNLITIQGGTGITTITPLTTNASDSAIAVTSTINTLGSNWNTGYPQTGYQYTLSGVPTGVTYSAPSSGPSTTAYFEDGASDGTNNYSVDFYTGNVYKFNGNWGNPTLLFSDTIGGYADDGIAYDTKNNTLWITNFYNATTYHYTLNGTLLGTLNGVGDMGLALDPADGTLWVYDGWNQMDQYSQTGVLLSTFQLPVEGDVIAGAEFAEATPTPIPGALLLFAPGLAGLAFVRRRFGK